MRCKRSVSLLSLITLTCLVVAVRLPQPAEATQITGIYAQTEGPVAPEAPARQGAWVDSVVFTEEPAADVAITQLVSDELDIYAYGVTDPLLYQAVQGNPDLTYSIVTGNYNELFFNPAVFTDTTRLNPFANTRIREAVNWLINRNHIVQNIYGGLAVPKFLPIKTNFPEYNRYAGTCHALETQYAYNWEQARNVITTEMQAMGATLMNEQWHYNGSPVTLIAIIRVEDERLQIGDYVSDQLETLGFVVDRQYKTGAEAGPFWLTGNPYAGEFHFYTGGWVNTSGGRDESSNFDFFYTPRGYSLPIWQTYAPTPEFDDISYRLATWDFQDMTERGQLFTEALGRSLNDPGAGSLHTWLVHEQAFYPRRADTLIASAFFGGIVGAHAWPFTVRFTGQEGGVMRIAAEFLLSEPWNPIAGTGLMYDMMIIRATQDYDTLTDPSTGLAWPQRIERAELLATQGLPVQRTHGWVDLTFTPTITVPGDAWVDWDATTQQFITADEKYTQTTTAMVKSTVYYPADLFTTVQWHDGTPLDLADFIMRMIMTFDPGKPGSPIYNEDLESRVESFLTHFRGVRIVSADPLVIETYENQVQLDAESTVVSWWPTYAQGPAAWHNLAVGVRADAAQALAFTSGKADQLQIDWMNFVDGPSLGILEGYMDQATIDNYIPYSPTLGLYVTTGEATTRWANLQAWHDTTGHFWLGTGPFYLDQASSASGTATLLRFPTYPDPASKWDYFVERSTTTLNYTDGAPGSYFTLQGENFPPNTIVHLSVNGQELDTVTTDAAGEFLVILNTLGADEGYYVVVAAFNPNVTARFTLDAAQPTHPQEGSGTIIQVPPGIAFSTRVYLPVVMRPK